MKTAEEILHEAYKKIELVQDDSAEVIDPILLGMIEEYAEQFKPKWTPVSERLPEEKTDVLIINVNAPKDTPIIISFVMYEEFYSVLFPGTSLTVTHWMLLPDPIKK